MASTSDRKTWEEQAAFMREVGALHAEFSTIEFVDDQPRVMLTKLVLGPPPASAATPAQPVSPAKRLLAMHETQFASSRFKPPFVPPKENETDVPRAVRAKEGTSRGPKKVSKRGS